MSGKGDKPRNCFTKKYKDNFDEVDWKRKKKIKQLRRKVRDS